MLTIEWASLVVQMVKNLPVRQETWVQSLGWEDSLEEDMATHSSLLAWRIPWPEEPGSYSPWGCKGQAQLGDCHFIKGAAAVGFPSSLKLQ